MYKTLQYAPLRGVVRPALAHNECSSLFHTGLNLEVAIKWQGLGILNTHGLTHQLAQRP